VIFHFSELPLSADRTISHLGNGPARGRVLYSGICVGGLMLMLLLGMLCLRSIGVDGAG
jgi:hypothetical protein